MLLRWNSLVHAEKFDQESELDRLRDHIPKDAKTLLCGCVDLKKAWELLTEMYGNTDLLAGTLKKRLKNLKYPGEINTRMFIKVCVGQAMHHPANMIQSLCK